MSSAGVRSRRAVRLLVLIGALTCWALPGGGAEIGSDHPAAIVVFPKLLVDTSSGLDTMVRISNIGPTPLNVLCFYINVTPICPLSGGSCFPHQLTCSAGGHTAACIPQWQPTDFTFKLTREQPTGWLVSRGETVNCRFLDGRCSHDGTTVCERDSQCGAGNRCVQPACFPLEGGLFGRSGPQGQFNEGAVPLSPSDPFIGELKCIAIDDTHAPVARNDLIGEVLIGKIRPGSDDIQLAGYNGIGIPAIAGANNRDDTLVLGGANAEYEGCPNILILDHFFDGAVDPVIQNICLSNGTCSVSNTACTDDGDCVENTCLQPPGACSVTGGDCASDADCQNTCGADNRCTLTGNRCLRDTDCVPADFQVRLATDLTLIPCTQDYEERDPALARTTAQFLVFNEYEQRFSTSQPIDCFREFQLSQIDTTDSTRSIFSAGVSGTLSGQTRIRGVVNDDTAGRSGNTLIGVAEEFRCGGPRFTFPACDFVNAERLVSGAAKNLHFQGRRPQSDFIYLP
ncbi:MAG: hypothetical protein AB7V27_06745 [Candidatus Binatia bacterium]